MIDLAVLCKNCGKAVNVQLPQFGDTPSPELLADKDTAQAFRAWLWTTDPPTVEGWYWVYFPKGTYPDGVFCVEIEFDYEGQPMNLHDAHNGWFLENVTHWLGPLPVPEPPK